MKKLDYILKQMQLVNVTVATVVGANLNLGACWFY